MERGRRQHEAERVETGGDAVGQASWAVSAQQDDRGLNSRELALLLGTGGTILANDAEVARHEGKWLGGAPFQLPQLRDRSGIAGITGQMVAADPFNCDDLSGTDQVGGPFDVVARGGVGIAGCASQCDQFGRRAAARTGNRFGVKATVAGIAVFSATVRTEGERRHRRCRAIVRDGGDDAQPRSAMRAAREGIAVMPIAAVSQLGAASHTDRGVRRNLGLGSAARALSDAKFGGQGTGV